MPVTPTYPGVYIQEVDSGSRVVTGVATSITAFVGRAPLGPVNEPVMVYDFGEFQRTFGGRARGLPMTYAVEDFFGNGGGQALIVRATPADATPATLAGPPALSASSPGRWGNAISVKFEKVSGQDAIDIEQRFAEFNLGTDGFYFVDIAYPVLKGKTPTPAERVGPVYLGPTEAPCRIDQVLAAQSLYIRAAAPVAAAVVDTTKPVAPVVDTTKTEAPVVDTAKAETPVVDTTKTETPVTDTTKTVTPAAVAASLLADYVPLSNGGDGNAAGGGRLTSNDIVGDSGKRTGMYALDHADLFNILVVPPDSGPETPDADLTAVLTAAAPYCDTRRAIMIADPLSAWSDHAKQGAFGDISPADLNVGELGQRRRIFTYFPRIKKLDPANANREAVFSASGMIAGIFAATDVRRGVWKAPAGIEAGLTGVTALEHRLTDMQNGVLNQVGINVLRDFPVFGKVIWGSRTLAGADALSDDYKYLPVRRLTDYIEESLFRGTKFAVFEPNSETLWAQLRLTCNTFMADLNRQGAFYNYYVECDKSTTTPYDIDRGRVNVIIAFAPVKPAEFVILTIQQLAGQTAA